MISKFGRFINELKTSTYLKAADKLARIGHINRSKLLKSYSRYHLNIGLGTFNLNCNIVEKTIPRRISIGIEDYDPNSPVISPNKIIKGGPLPCYFANISSFFAENLPEEANHISNGEKLDFVFFLRFSHPEIEMPFSPFSISIEGKWIGDFLKIESNPVIGRGLEGEFELFTRFSDRRSALKFRKLLFDKDQFLKYLEKGEYSVLREFFMEHSNMEEFKKFFDVLKNIPINSLYR